MVARHVRDVEVGRSSRLIPTLSLLKLHAMRWLCILFLLSFSTTIYSQKRVVKPSSHNQELLLLLKEKVSKPKTVLVLPAYNGYMYLLTDLDMGPYIEKAFAKIDRVEVLPFPYKKLMGVIYQEVNDKRYCAPIQEVVDVDYIVMSAYLPESPVITDNMANKSGYRIMILNTRTNVQTEALSISGKNSYKEVGEAILRNSSALEKAMK